MSLSLMRHLKKLGSKWQMDVKYIPKHSYTGSLPDKFYQYTIIDEASRERFIFLFKEQSSHSTIQFLKLTIKHFGYKHQIIQTDSSFEFTHFKETKQIHPLDLLCQELGIEHKLIRPRTPRHRLDIMVRLKETITMIIDVFINIFTFTPTMTSSSR